MAARQKMLGLGLALIASSCFSDGREPPLGQLQFPVALALDATARHLFVVSSNFDLRYNGGSLHAFDTVAIARLLPRPCQADTDCLAGELCDNLPGDLDAAPTFQCAPASGPLRSNPCGALGRSTVAERVLVPGPCRPAVPSLPQDGGAPLFTDAIKIGTFGTDLAYAARPENAPAGPGGRLFIPVRGTASLLAVDVEDDGLFRCGSRRGDGSCSEEFSVDAGIDATGAGFDLPLEPAAVALGPEGRAILVAHQVTSGPQLSIFDHDWAARGPVLRRNQELSPSSLGGRYRPGGLTAISGPNLRGGSAFLTTARTSPEVRLLELLPEAVTSPEPPIVQEAARTLIRANAVGTDSRGVAVDASERLAAISDCARTHGVPEACVAALGCAEASRPDFVQCFEQASRISIDVFVASRSPASLLIGRGSARLGAVSESPSFQATVPLPFGPSRVVVGKVIGQDGALESRVFVVCFDARIIAVYDPARKRIETEIRTGRGPQALVIDEARGLGYVAHFTDSYLGVVDLDRRHPHHYGRIVLSVGVPTPPKAAK